MPDGHSVILSRPLRQPPTNLEAEQALLGALLSNKKAYEYVGDFLLPDHFACPAHGRIYQAIQRRIKNDELADAVTLKAEFEHAGILDEVGGTAYLTQLLTAMVGIINAGDYGRAIHDAWLRRELIDKGETIVNQAFGGCDGHGEHETAVDLLERVTSELTVLGTSGPGSAAGSSISGAARAAMNEGLAAHRKEVAESVSTGIPSLDAAIGLLRMGKMYVIAGRPSMGKTALMNSVAFNAAMGRGVTLDGEIIDDQKRGVGVGLFFLEGTDEDLGAAALSNISGVPADDILSGKAYEDPLACLALERAQRRLDEAGGFLETFTRAKTLSAIRAQVRVLHRKMKGRLKIVVVDYLQRMNGPPGVKEPRLRHGENVCGLADLADDLGICIIVGAQLAKDVDKRPDHRPMLGDLRETSEIEEAAWVVAFPYREAKYFAETRPKFDRTSDDSWSGYQFRLAEWQREYDAIADKAEIIVAKNKRGPAPMVIESRFNGPCVKFEEPAPEPHNAR